MRRQSTSRKGGLNLPSLVLEGALFLPDQLQKAAQGQAQLQSEQDYRLAKGRSLKDEYSRAFQIACAQWKSFSSQQKQQGQEPQELTAHFVRNLLKHGFGYESIQYQEHIQVDDRRYPVNLLAGSLPVVVAPFDAGLDESLPLFAVEGSGSRKKSAFAFAQELLNASDRHLWALATNGQSIRLLRDASSLTRPSFIEIDLGDILEAKRYSEFATAWRLLHSSRAPASSADNPHCVWEQWRSQGQVAGTRVREGLRQGVEQALLELGQGFVEHQDNLPLRQALDDGSLSLDGYFQQLLRLIYRLIFIFTVEERGLLHPEDPSARAREAREAYQQGYALGRLRDLCLKRRARNRFDDHWQATRILFRGLQKGEPLLALPALGGLFAADQCQHLDRSRLSNQRFLAVIQHLRWAFIDQSLSPIDYRNMGPEELGSVYESLLELVPSLSLGERRFGFVGLTDDGSTSGNARKLTGSYYTPDSLVQELIRSALEPVIAKKLEDANREWRIEKGRVANSEWRMEKEEQQPFTTYHLPLADKDPLATHYSLFASEAILSIRVIDPACGSGHFLLAAARRLAEELARVRSLAEGQEGIIKPQDYRHALREVIGHCIFGVDRNPMAIELARTALWLEGFEEGRPLGFLDHHLQVGDALLGLTDLKALEKGIAKDAFKPLSGDDKETCKQLAKANAAALKQMEKMRDKRQLDLPLTQRNSLSALQSLEALPQASLDEISRKQSAWQDFLEQSRTSPLRHAADMLVGAFLLPKTPATQAQTPTSASLLLELMSDGEHQSAEHRAQLKAAQQASTEARVFHWPLAFPQVFAQGGFDCVLGNPPWERIKLQEEEFFATRHRDVAEAKNKAERSQRIQWLAEGMLARHLYPELAHEAYEDKAEQRQYQEFLSARRTAEAASLFAHVKGDEGGRYPLTGVGDVNTYALFAETISQITHPQGRAGFIVPTGIATDDSTKAYFGHITQNSRLVSLFDIENRDKLFAAVDSRMKFCLLTLGRAEQAGFVCFATNVGQLADPRRRFSLTPDDFRLINPNTLTCPVFRSQRDAELTKKLYRAAPVLMDENRDNGNPWGISFMAMMHMSGDSHLFADHAGPGLLPLYEAKMIHQFDHRWATYTSDGASREVTDAEKADPATTVTPRYWVSQAEVEARLQAKGWQRGWLMGWRDICRATDERTVIASVVPRVGVGHTMPLFMTIQEPGKVAALLGNFDTLVLDFCARVKVGGTHLTYSYLKQFPVLPPNHYTDTDLAFIVPRVLELTYTAHDLKAWAQDLVGEWRLDNGEWKPDTPLAIRQSALAPFPFNPTRRAQLRAELDAWYARLYGLTRDELRYILDPADVMGEDYPSETFRVLKNKELKEYGEYRTRRLVLDAWDRLERGELN